VPKSSETVVIAPSPLYLGKLALALAAGFAIVALFTGGFDAGTVVVWLLMMAFIWWFLRLKLSPDGIAVGVNRSPWSKLQLGRTRRGAEVLVSVNADSWRERVAVSLANYEGDWQAGRIGDAIRRWRPDLLQPGRDL
jgi:hypothetical protein